MVMGLKDVSLRGYFEEVISEKEYNSDHRTIFEGVRKEIIHVKL